MGSCNITNCRLIDSVNNNNITVESRGTCYFIFITGATNRLTITETGAMTFHGGMGYDNATDTLTATIFNGTATNVSLSDNNTDAVLYPVFASGTGSRPLLVDSTIGPFSILILGLLD